MVLFKKSPVATTMLTTTTTQPPIVVTKSYPRAEGRPGRHGRGGNQILVRRTQTQMSFQAGKEKNQDQISSFRRPPLTTSSSGQIPEPAGQFQEDHPPVWVEPAEKPGRRTAIYYYSYLDHEDDDDDDD